jgi:hypothetical protein
MSNRALPDDAAPRLMYHAKVTRWRYFRRAFAALIGGLAAGGATFVLTQVLPQGVIVPALVIDIGLLAGIALTAWFALRMVINVLRMITRHSAEIRVYDKGFVWKRGDHAQKYAWRQLISYRESGRGLYLFGRPMLQWGGHELITDDGEIHVFRAGYGSFRTFAAFVRPFADHATSVKMSQALRQNQPVMLHKKLTVYPGGVQAKGVDIAWSEVDAVTDKARKTLRIRTRDRVGWRTVARFKARSVENVGGFIELTRSMQSQFQPQRFRGK